MDIGFVTHPFWLKYHVWLHPGLKTFDFASILTEDRGGYDQGNLEQCLTKLYAPGTNVRERCMIHSDDYLDPLRNIVFALGVPYVIEYYTGSSWKAFRGIDLYFRFVPLGKLPDPYTYWVGNETYPPLDRFFLWP